MGPQLEGGPSNDDRAYGGVYNGNSPRPSDSERYHQTQDHDQSQGGRTPTNPNSNGSLDRLNAPAPADPNARKLPEGRKSGERNISRTRTGRTGSGQLRICRKCMEPLTGQFVRALGGTFHLDCFRCKDCGEIVASKFFPVDDEDGSGNQYPLCETDYFRRLDLLCHQCGGALRGSYITALDHKYHIDHFTCSVCPTVFGAQDSYYEHDGQVYCHYHYSTQFAQRCNGCQTAILKQFVEIFRNGQNQHWHPECYMIHKFWNVRLAASADLPSERPGLEDNADEAQRNAVKEEEERMEEKVYRIWSVLSTFEESSAACISDMLLHVSNGAYIDGVFVAKKFISHVDILFGATDTLDSNLVQQGMNGLSYSREAKLLSKKIVAFFSLLSKKQETGVRKLGVTQELLSLVTGLAHYLKLLIRICLQGSLKIERERQNADGLHRFLDDLSDLESIRNDEKSLEMTTGVRNLADSKSDQCAACKRAIEEECGRTGDKRFHLSCLACSKCARELGQNLEDVMWSDTEFRVYCTSCSNRAADSKGGFEYVTRLQQYVFLLRVALARLLEMLRNSGSLPHTSDDPNLNGYDSNDGHRLSTVPEPALLNNDTRSKSFGGHENERREEAPSSYENTLNDVRRLRSTRMDKHLSTTIKKARTSRIIDGPEGRSVRPGSAGADGSDAKNNGMSVVEDRETNSDSRTELMFGNQDALTLDDIPRIVATQQAKEQRPNAYKHARHDIFNPGGMEPKLVNGHERQFSSGNELDLAAPMSDPSPQRGAGTKKYFSELSALDYFMVRHLAVLSMQPLLEPHYSMDELLLLIESRKQPTFWNKMGKAFKNDKGKNIKKKGVFGVPLDALLERDYADSTGGVGPGTLRIPALVDNSIETMKNMDLSVEGVFRKNGNIKRLNDTVALIDRDGCAAVDLEKENVVQVAALLKKFLRELPDPLLTYKLHRLFIASQKITDEDKRRRVLHLICCLLPQSHRDCLEVLCTFLNWTASFHQVDEESGSKMDVHNLATVIAPNILFSNSKIPGMDDSLLAIEAVHALIEFNEQMCEVPEDFQSMLADKSLSSVFNNSSEATTREILKRCEQIAGNSARNQTPPTELGRDNEGSGSGSGRMLAPVVTRVDTDPFQTHAWQKESSVRHVREPDKPYAGSPSNQNTPPHPALQDADNQPAPYISRSANRTPDSQNEGGKRDWRNSGWNRPRNGSVGVTGAT